MVEIKQNEKDPEKRTTPVEQTPMSKGQTSNIDE